MFHSIHMFQAPPSNLSSLWSAKSNVWAMQVKLVTQRQV